MGRCKVIGDMLNEVKHYVKCEMALKMLTITNLSFVDIVEVIELTVDKVRKISKDTNKEKIYI